MLNPKKRPKSSPSDRLAEAFDRWYRLDQRLQREGPAAVSMEEIAAAWKELIQLREEWSLAR